MRDRRVIVGAVFGCLCMAGLVAYHVFHGPAGPAGHGSYHVLHGLAGPAGHAYHVQPRAVMGTQCALTAVVGRSRAEQRRAEKALRQAEAALRAVEARMSTYLDLSELSRFNASPAGEVVKLSPDTLAVLHLAKELHGQSHGAFDVTCLGLFNLWARAGRAQRVPADAEVATARAAGGWDKIELLDGGARKSVAAAGLGLGGIAKGFAIDRALGAIWSARCAGGLVDVGGDIRCFGVSPRGDRWRVAVRNPFDTRGTAFFGTLALTDAAVCTSGNYERYTEIDGKRYSHIVDPRTGRPVDFAPSVTVVAPTSAVADGWATALSVLGPKGLELLPSDGGLEAMIVVGGPADYTIHQTPGFAKLLVSPIPPPPGRPGGASGPSSAPGE